MSDYDHGSFYDPGALPPDPANPHADPYTGPPASGYSQPPSWGHNPGGDGGPAGSGYAGPPAPWSSTEPGGYGGVGGYGGPSPAPSYHPTEPFPASSYPPPAGAAYPAPPAYVVHSVPAPTNTAAVAAFVTGLLGLVLCWFPFLGLLLAVLGIALGAIGFAQSRQSGHGSGFAVAGLILGSVAIIPAFFILLAVA